MPGDPPRPDRSTLHATAWTAATTDLCLLTVAGLLALHLGGNLADALEPIGTFAGVLLFVVLWLATWMTHLWAMAPAAAALANPDGRVPQPTGLGFAAGALTGLAFLLVLAVALAVAERDWTVLALAVLSIVPMAAAMLLGGLAGILFAGVHRLLVAWAVRVAGPKAGA